MGVLADLAMDVGLGALAVVVAWAALFVGRERLARLAARPVPTFRPALPSLALLGGVLVVNRFAREVAPEVSWVVGWNVTGLIYALEGNTVATLQSVAFQPLTAFFSFVYLPGYVSLLVFPFVAYVPLSDHRPVRVTAVAYALNYSIGLTCYVLFIAYGPRNLIPDLVDPLLYATYPSTQLLTGEVNANTNVFPSLHTSLSVTVAVLAYRTRRVYRAWAVVAPFAAACVAFSTMYLGIHWATDVVAGGVLGVTSVSLARRYVDRRSARGRGDEAARAGP